VLKTASFDDVARSCYQIIIQRLFFFLLQNFVSFCCRTLLFFFVSKRNLSLRA